MSAGVWDEQPIFFPEIAPFREALRQGRFSLPQCRACGAVHWYPRAVCPFCDQGDIDWIESRGRGRIYSWTASGAGPDRRILAYVTLDEGVTLIARIQPGESGTVAIDQIVEPVLGTTDSGAPSLWFRLVDQACRCRSTC